ncbi:hypothetical protein ON010_g567 [Phytophthora cinnamomi]|nr:hypothetical protein ON010_g567 [Phytophthora cinnamomi]
MFFVVTLKSKSLSNFMFLPPAEIFADAPQISAPAPSAVEETANVDSRSRPPPETFMFNDVTAAMFKEWHVIKKNKYGKKQQRMLGIDLNKIYNRKVGERVITSSKSTKIAERPMSGVVWVRFNQDPSEFQIYFKDSIEEIITDYTADSPYECGTCPTGLGSKLGDGCGLIAHLFIRRRLEQPRSSPSSSTFSRFSVVDASAVLSHVCTNDPLCLSALKNTSKVELHAAAPSKTAATTAAPATRRRPPAPTHVRKVQDRESLVSECSWLGRLHLEATRFPAATGALELAALAADVRLDVVVRVHRLERRLVAEVGVHAAGLAGATEQHRVGALGGTQGQLVEAQALTASLDDAGAGRLGEVEGHDRELGDVQQTDVVRHGAHHDGDLALVLLHEASDLAQGQRSLVGVALVEATQHDVVELGVRATSQEAVQANEQVQVHIVRLGVRAVLLADDLATSDKINTLQHSALLPWLARNSTAVPAAATAPLVARCGAGHARLPPARVHWLGALRAGLMSIAEAQRTILLVLKLKLDEDGAAKRLPEALSSSRAPRVRRGGRLNVSQRLMRINAMHFNAFQWPLTLWWLLQLQTQEGADAGATRRGGQGLRHGGVRAGEHRHLAAAEAGAGRRPRALGPRQPKGQRARAPRRPRHVGHRQGRLRLLRRLPEERLHVPVVPFVAEGARSDLRADQHPRGPHCALHPSVHAARSGHPRAP